MQIKFPRERDLSTSRYVFLFVYQNKTKYPEFNSTNRLCKTNRGIYDLNHQQSKCFHYHAICQLFIRKTYWAYQLCSILIQPTCCNKLFINSIDTVVSVYTVFVFYPTKPLSSVAAISFFCDFDQIYLYLNLSRILPLP